MKLWVIFWAYWKWFCTALVTSTVVLLLIATLVQTLTRAKPDTHIIDQCIDKGGTWDEGEGACKAPA